METYGYNNPEQNDPKGNFNNYNQPYQSEKKIPAGLLAIFLGSFGIHKFYMGYNQEGAILLVATLVLVPILSLITCGMGIFLYFPLGIIPLVEGIIYLAMNDRQFDQTYIENKKPWF